MKRLVWLDIAKGLAILWVVYFHFFKTYRDWAPYPMSGLQIRDWPPWAFLAISVAVLIVLSAWGIVLEKFANAVLEKIIGGKKKPAAQAA